MKRNAISAATVALLTGIADTANAQRDQDVVTRTEGYLNVGSEGIVKIYGADWCVPCNLLEQELEKSGIMENLAAAGITFEFIRNQEYGNTKTRVNEHLKTDKELGGLPNIFIYDTGISSGSDKEELAVRNIRNSKRLEEIIERYALDRKVSLLTIVEGTALLEAVGSNLFNISYSNIDNVTGFTVAPKDTHDPRTLQEMARLHTIGPAIRIVEPYISEQKQNSKEIKKSSTFEEARKTQHILEEGLSEENKIIAEDIHQYLDYGPLFFPFELRETSAAKYYANSGKLVLFQHRIPTDKQLETIRVNQKYIDYFGDEIDMLKRERDDSEWLYKKFATRDIWYVPENAPEIFNGDTYVEGQIEKSNRGELANKNIWVQAPIVNFVAGPQTYGVSQLLPFDKIKELKKNH